jgi:hypothetical protein
MQTGQHLDHPEHRETDDQELDHGIEEDAKVQWHRAVAVRADRHATVAGPLRAAWSRPKQTDLVSDKRQFRSRFPQSAQLRLSDNDFSGSPQPTPTSSQRNTSGRAGWKRLGPVVTTRSRSLGRQISECWL